MNVNAGDINQEFASIRYDLYIEDAYMVKTLCEKENSYTREKRMVDLFLLSAMLESTKGLMNFNDIKLL